MRRTICEQRIETKFFLQYGVLAQIKMKKMINVMTLSLYANILFYLTHHRLSCKTIDCYSIKFVYVLPNSVLDAVKNKLYNFVSVQSALVLLQKFTLLKDE